MKNRIKAIVLSASLAAAIILSGVSAFAADSNTSGREVPSSSTSTTTSTRTRTPVYTTTTSSSSSSKSSSSSSSKSSSSKSSSSLTTEKGTTSTGVSVTIKTSSKGTATLSKTSSSKKSVVISKYAKADGVKYKITKIGAKAFANCSNATKVVLPGSVKSLGANAFTGANKLTSVRLKTSKAIAVSPSAFSGKDTSKMTITVNKNMSDAQFNKLQSSLNKAGFKGVLQRAAR